MNETSNIFISYSSVDRVFADELYLKMKNAGLNCFLDRKDIELGAKFKAVISGRLAACSELIIIASPASIKSQWVCFEIGHAVALQKDVIPIRTHPSIDLPTFLSDFQAARDQDQLIEYLVKKYSEKTTPSPVKIPNTKGSDLGYKLELPINVSVKRFIDRFDDLKFLGHAAIDGAVELHTFPTQVNSYGGINSSQTSTNINNSYECSDRLARHLNSRQLSKFGEALRNWVGDRRAKPNRIRVLTKAPAQMVLDNNEYSMEIGNSDYFTMRTITEIQRSLSGAELGDLEEFFDSWWSPPQMSFPDSAVPYHISALAAVILKDGTRRRDYLILTLPSPHRAPLVPGWNVTFAEQMWAPTPETPISPWWENCVGDLSIEQPAARHGDTSIWDTMKRGAFEEIGLDQRDIGNGASLVGSFIEPDMFFVGYFFVVNVVMSLEEFYLRKISAPDKEIGPVAAYPISGKSDGGEDINTHRQLLNLIYSNIFDGGKFILPSPVPNASKVWHISSRMRIYMLGRHLLGNQFLKSMALM